MTLSIERCLIFANQCTDMSETSLKSMIPFLLNGRYILYFVKLYISLQNMSRICFSKLF